MRTQPDAGQPDRLASMKNDSDVTKYVLSLSVEQADSLERIAISRVGLGVEVSGTDIVLEAIDEYVARLERSPKSLGNTPPKPSGVLFEFLFGGNAEQAFGRLSEGIVAILGNAQMLIDDATVLGPVEIQIPLSQAL